MHPTRKPRSFHHRTGVGIADDGSGRSRRSRNADRATAEKSNPMKTDSAAPHLPEPPDFSLSSADRCINFFGGRVWPGTRWIAAPPRRRFCARWPGCRCCSCRCRRTRLGRECQAAVSPRRRDTRSSAARGAAVDLRGTDRPPADARSGGDSSSRADLCPDAARAKFDAAITSAMRLRNSVTVEVLLIALVYVVGVGFLWRTQFALAVPSGLAWWWTGSCTRRSPAGGWAA